MTTLSTRPQEFGSASQATPGRRAGLDRSDVVTALNELAGRGLVESTRDPDDHRRNIVTLTPAGAAQLERLDGLLADVQDELPAPQSPRERDLLTRLLTRVLGYHTSTFE